MELTGIWGQFGITVDDKGRFLLPARIRKQVEGDVLILTKGAERCLWLFLPEEWARVSETLVANASIYKLSTQDVLRRFIAPAEEVPIDKAGRIKLSPSLMKSVGLTRECLLLGMGERLELWDEGSYEHYEAERSTLVKDTWEGLGLAGGGVS